MKFLILIAFCLLTAATCKNKNADNVKVKHDTTFVDVKGNRYKMVGEIPDSLRTAEQKKYFSVFRDVLLNDVVVENNQIILKLTKEECLAKGLTEQDYNTLQANLRDTKSYLDSHGVKNIDSAISDMQAQMLKSK